MYLDNNVTSEDIKEIEEELNNIEGIKSIKYKSKNDVKEEMADESEVLNTILDEFTDETNPFSDRFTLEIEDYHKKEEIIKKINNLDHIKAIY